MRAYVSTRPVSIQASFGDAPALYARADLIGMNAVNDGIVVAPEGNISIVGRKIFQNGLLQAVTTLNAAGNISLIAHDGYRFSPFGGNSDARAGELILGPDSITTVQIDRDPRTGTGGTGGNSSFVRLWGNRILLDKNALVQSEAGQISIGAFSKLESGSSSLELPTVPSGAGSRFMMEAGAVLDVAGVLGAEVSMESNSVQVEARANELRDAPLQRNGILAGKKVWVDRRVTGKREDGTVWFGTEVLDANEYIANVPTSMGERAVKGGKVTMYAGEVVVMPDAEINIAGGSIRYLDGYVKTTRLLGADGRRYDIGRAPADMLYVNIDSGFAVDHSRWDHGNWKASEVFSSPLSHARFEAGYEQGAAAGSLEIYSRVQVLDGRIAADTVLGGRQISSPPAGGALKIGSVSPPETSFNAIDLRLQAAAAGLPGNFTMASALPADRTSTLVLSTEMLNESGLSSVELIVNGSTTFASDSDIRLLPGSTFSISTGSANSGKSVVVDGSIRMPGGVFSLLAQGGPVTVMAGARIDVSGQWTKELLSAYAGRRSLNGGLITLAAGGANTLTFENGAVLAADAGATVGSRGNIKIGAAGMIKLEGSNTIGLGSVTMSAYGLAASDRVITAPAGGELFLSLPAILIAPDGGTPTGNTIGLDPSFFDRGGFSRFTFNLAGIQDGVTFAPRVQTRVLTADRISQASSDNVSGFAPATTLSADQRPGSSLRMTTTGSAFVLGTNTTIAPGIGGSVSIGGGAGSVTIAGKIDAPAGSIIISGNSVTLASTAQLLARGVARIVADGRGLRSGDVLDGGSIDISPARDANLVAGALIDVSGTSGTIDIADRTAARGSHTRALTLASDGGAISIGGSGGLAASTLIGNAGGEGAAGGQLLLGAASPTVTVSSVPTTVYFQDANGVWQSRTAAQDLDIFNEYSGAAITLNSVVAAERTKFINATRNGSGGLLTIVNNDSLVPGGTGWESVSTSLQEADPTILQNSLNAAALYTKYYYNRSGSGTAASPFVYTKLNYAPAITEFAVRQSAFEQGGFADISLSGSKIGVRFGDGVDISAGRRISVTAATVTNWSGASATLRAPLVTFDAGKATVTGANRAGTFEVFAQQIDVSKAAFKGFADVTLNTTGDLLFSGSASNPASLYVDGRLNLIAGQIYPTTQTTARITATQTITVDPNGAHAVAPLSAGGNLILTAPTIVQNGTLRAPFGQITLDATTSLTLGSGSLTSVSGAGLIVPFGRIVDDVLWYTDQSPNTPILAPPEKRLTLKAPAVDMQAGSVVDLSGGGDLLAYGFIPGSGGSSDYLDTAKFPGALAILPINMVSNHVGKRIIHFDGGAGIPAGDYVVMPASYALLPGAYRLQAMTGSNGQPIYDLAAPARLSDGSVVLSGWGHVGGTDIRDQRVQAYKISPIETIRQRSEYKVWTANEYFRSNEFVEAARRQLSVDVTAVPRLPMDAGALQIQATLSAILGATLRGSAEEGGRGAAIDVAASNIAVAGGVDAASYRAAGYLVLDAAQLSAFGGESLLLGGTRLQTVSGLEVDATATNVVIATDGTVANALAGPEILIASENAIQVADGSLIEARGTVGGASSNILIKPAIAAVTDAGGNVTTPARDFGAFARISNGAAVRVIRDGPQQTQGTLTIGAATLRGDSIILDATKTTSVSAGAALLGRVLDVTSSRISIGTPTGTPGGLILAGGSLAALLNAVDLRLRSYGTIDFYGDVGLGTRHADGSFTLASLLLDAAALNSNAAANVSIAAGEVAIVNTIGGAGASLGGAGGTLAITANTLSLGAGTKKIDGFGAVQLAASKAIIGRGKGSIDFGSANLAFNAPRLTAESGASQDWTTTGTLGLAGTPASDAFETLGARLAITAAAITQSGLIDVTAGSLILRATAGNVTLTSGSIIRASGFTRVFYDQRVEIAGGAIELISDHGMVVAQAGSLLDVSAVGNAGTLAIATPEQVAQLDGELRAGHGGNFVLDTGSIASFAALSTKLAAGGFDGDLLVRLRTGNVTLDGATRASAFALSADAGSITVTGTVDVGAANGGTIRLAAKQDLSLASGAVIRANVSDPRNSSGLIELAAAEGNMDLRAGATIETLGGRNGAGEIRLRFKRDDAAGTVKLVSAAATTSAAKIIAEAYRAYDTASVNTTLPSALADAASFMTNHGASIEAALGRGGDPKFHLVPGIDLYSTGDLTLSSAVHLGDTRYNGEAGILTLRAAGNLMLNGSLSDGFASAAANAAVQTTGTASWSYRLVGGAALDGASPLAVQPIGAFAGGTSGSVRLASGTIVRTGTGSIMVAAGNDVVLADQKAVIYTAGARVTDPTLGGTYTGTLDFSLTNPTPSNPNNLPPVVMPVFTEGGGNVVVRAQNDVKSLTASDQMIIDWLWRDGGTNADGSFIANRQPAWWFNFARFEQGIAALGGGNVFVEAGRDIVNVSAFTPTQGRVGGGRTLSEAKTAVITGGGDLSVGAGRDLVGGFYYVDKGTGTISAGRAITSNRTVSFDPDGSGSQQQPRDILIRTMLGLGDAALMVTAGGSIDLGSASNPTLWDQADYQNVWRPTFPVRSYFSTYGERTELQLASVGGDITLWNQAGHLSSAAPAWASYKAGLSNGLTGQTTVYYPGRLRMIAAAGDITIQGGMAIWPSASGNIDIWAQDTVNLLTQVRSGAAVEGTIYRTLVLSSVNPQRLGTFLKPLASMFSAGGTPLDEMGLDVLLPATGFKDNGLLHANDYEPSRIYANTGEINGPSGQSFYQYFAEQTWFRAGRDINNLKVAVLNNHMSDLTLFQAGRDINLALGRISIDGPGFVLVEAGRDVFLGKGGGIQTVGNGEAPGASGVEAARYRSPYLPRKGADLAIMAGTADGPRYDDFIAAYLYPANVAAMPSYLVANGKPIYFDQLVDFMRVVTRDATMSEAAAFVAFLDPRYADHRKIFIDRVLSRELRAAGRGQDAGLGREGLGYERGYAAIATLFPGAEQRGNKGWQGDVIMDVSMIRTYRGGDVDILTPGGMLQVSALSSNATGEKNGVLTINGGEIRILTGVSTIINKSRILTARGGEITIWSTFGDIDAGKGRKSSLTSPLRTYRLSADGNINFDLNPSFTGSGISTQKGTLDAAVADVDLYAPNGIINAGDAGISSSGNIFLGALEIRGADNIQAAGEIKGLPKATTSVALTVETKDKAASDALKDATQVAPQERPSVIIVEVLGYGGGAGVEEEDRRRERRSDNVAPPYNPSSPVRIIGVGALTEEEKQSLRESERKQIGSAP